MASTEFFARFIEVQALLGLDHAGFQLSLFPIILKCWF